MVFTIPLSKLVLLMEKKLSGKGVKAKAEDTSSVIEAEELENEQERLADQTAAYREGR